MPRRAEWLERALTAEAKVAALRQRNDELNTDIARQAQRISDLEDRLDARDLSEYHASRSLLSDHTDTSETGQWVEPSVDPSGYFVAPVQERDE